MNGIFGDTFDFDSDGRLDIIEEEEKKSREDYDDEDDEDDDY